MFFMTAVKAINAIIFLLFILFHPQSYTLFSKQPNVFSKMFTKTRLKDFFTEPTGNRKTPATTFSVP